VAPPISFGTRAAQLTADHSRWVVDTPGLSPGFCYVLYNPNLLGQIIAFEVRPKPKPFDPFPYGIPTVPDHL
jgi:hypothetical protein